MAREKTATEQTEEAKQTAKKLQRDAKFAEKTADKLMDVASGRAAGFMNFIREQGVIGLAVGLAIGAQTNSTVKSIVDGLINPLVSFVLGSSVALSEHKWNFIGRDTEKINYLFTLGDRQLILGWGGILSSLIQLMAVAAVIYFVVKGFGFDKLDKKKE